MDQSLLRSTMLLSQTSRAANVDTKYLYVMGARIRCRKKHGMSGYFGAVISVRLCLQPVGLHQTCHTMYRKTDRGPVLRTNKNPLHGHRATLVFRKGFSRDFIDGLTKHSDELMADVLASILSIGKDKEVVIIDGVGDPSVGSVVGVSNVDVALSLPCNVIFVGKPGIGAALDNTVLCVSFMQNKGLTNIGIIYNKIPLSAFAEIKKYVTKRLPELLPEVTLLGFIGEDQIR